MQASLIPTENPDEATPPVSNDRPLSSPTVALFLGVALVLLIVIFAGQSVAWFLEQYAILSASAESLATAGKIWFVVQAVIVLLTSGLLYAFSHNMLRPVYQGWLLGSLLTLPALALRFIGPNNDQMGALIQIVIGLVGGGLVLALRRKSLDFSWRPALTALAIVPLAIWPFLLWGSFGSLSDAFLGLLAGLAFGLLVAGLVPAKTNHFLLDGLGLGVLMLIMGSNFGYDGGQLLLLAILPGFGFALATLTPSIPATTLGVGLLAAAPLIFIDPTELGLVLGDFLPWAIRATFLMTFSGWLLGLVLWLVRRWQDRPQSAGIPASIAAFGWLGTMALYLAFGLHGFHGDRLFVILKDQADVSQATQIKDYVQRRTSVYQTLTDHAHTSQAEIRRTFDRFGIHYTPYYLVNALEVDGGALVRLYLLTRPEVDRVLASPQLRPLPEQPGPISSDSTRLPENAGWNIKMIGADKVWAEFGVTGQGIVVGQSDSGVDGTHPALKDSYRGATQGDDDNWYDPWNQTRTPHDSQGHGTHTLGTVLGSGGIGVAPGAQWIGCVNLARNLGNPAVYLNCMQFMLAPFPQGGDPFKGDPARGAQVLNNSWGCPAIEGCDPNALKPAADALRAAGIFVAVSTGNDGPGCGTVNSPLALYDSVFSVGAVDPAGALVQFSSRGPVMVDGSERVKPDIVAPGAGLTPDTGVVSAVPGGGYASLSGTSMAGPHVAGVVALMWSADHTLIGDIDRTEQILIQTATRNIPLRSLNCSGTELPNDDYGYGIVDAYAAVKMALGK